MSQDLLLDLNDVGISEYKSVYSIEDQSKIDFINLLEERIMNKVNKLFVKKDEEIGALIDIISSQKDQIGRLNTELNLVKEKLSAHQLMTDGIFETLTEKIDNNYLSIKETDKITRGLYNVYQIFEYGYSDSGLNEPHMTNILTDHICLYYDTSILSNGDSKKTSFYLNTVVFNLKNLKYIIVNNGWGVKCNIIIKNYNKFIINLCCESNKVAVSLKKIKNYHMNIIELMLLLNINIIVDSENNSIDIYQINDKNKIDIDSILNSQNYICLKNALVECGYITI